MTIVQRPINTLPAAIVLGVGLFALDALLYLAFLAPRLVAGWETQAQTLSVFQRLLATTSAYCTANGFVLLTGAAAVVVAGLAWMAAGILPRQEHPATHTALRNTVPQG